MDDRQLENLHGEDDALVHALTRLVASSHVGELSEADAEWLNETLEQSAAARKLFLQMAQDTQALRVWASAKTNRDGLSVPPLENREDSAIAPPATGFIPLPQAIADLHSSLVGDVALSWRLPFLAMSGLVVVLAMFVGYLLMRPSAASLTGVAQPSEGKQVVGISTVRLRSGAVDLELPGIGNVIVEGPAVFNMLNPMRARLSEGKVRVHVTEKTGHGFVVETPYGDVTDLGTEFGLDVGKNGNTALVVFDGAVDLERPRNGASYVERLVRGEGVTYGAGGRANRIMSIVTGRTSTFERGGQIGPQGSNPVIVDVTDNIIDPSIRTFYEIVSGGLREDALAYVDREAHEWNGITARGMPSYLVGADYVKMFSDDKGRRDIEISVTLSCPAKLFVFHRDNLPKPDWLMENFRDTGERIGLDVAPWKSAKRVYGKDKYRRGKGPGNEVDYTYSIWERVITDPGVVQLGANTTYATWAGMYGIAAVRLPLASSSIESEEGGAGEATSQGDK